MSPHFPVANYARVSKVAKKLGFVLVRNGKGSHEIWRRESDGRQTTIPNHGKKDLKRRTLKAILDDLGISVDEFSNFK